MDRFSEQLLLKHNTGRDTVIRVLYCLGAAVLSAAAAAAAPFVGLVLPIAVIGGIIWALVWLMQGTVTEYEYIVTNDDLDIDKITGRRKRKRMITVSLSSVKSISEYSPDSEINADVTVMAHDETGENMYVLICNIKEYGDVAVIFNPNDRTLYNMIGGFSPKVKNEYAELYKRVTPKGEDVHEVIGDIAADENAGSSAESVTGDGHDAYGIPEISKMPERPEMPGITDSSPEDKA